MKRRNTVIVVLGLVAALWLVPTAAGGPSIGTLAKEVRGLAKQVRVVRKQAKSATALGKRNTAEIQRLAAEPPPSPGPAEAGAKIAARVRATGPTSTAGSASVRIPLTGDTWTQDATEMNVIYGQLDYEKVGSCQSAGTFGSVPGYLFVDVILDEKIVAKLGPVNATSGFLRPSAIPLFDTGEQEAHVLRLTIRDSCSGSGRFNVTTTRFNIVSIK